MKIICFHQSAELYGSDRSFLQVVQYLKGTGRFNEICVVLPREGPLVGELQQIGAKVLFMDLSLLSKTYLKKLQWGKIIFPLLQYRKKLKLIEGYDIVYVNTSVIIDFYVLAPFIRKKKVLHIREIPSKWLGKMLSFAINQSDAFVLFNSYSTKKSFGDFQKSEVIHNSFQGFVPTHAPEMRNGTQKTLRILLIGRINSWKGQDFAIESLSQLHGADFLLRIVGSPFAGNEAVLEQLKSMAKLLGLEEKIEFQDFVEDTQSVYEWADVVIVPSKKPEPFGRIAIEAMSLGKPVIAANHGGLPEIVVHDESGFLFAPNDKESFTAYVSAYLLDPQLLVEHGKRAKTLFMERFSEEKMHRALDDVFVLINKEG